MNNNNRSIVEQDELKRLTNRCIGKLLEELGEAVSISNARSIKTHIRYLEENIRKNIFNIGNSNDTTEINQ